MNSSYNGAASPAENHVTTIVIADDHPLFRHGLRDVMSEEASFRILADVGDGSEALRAIEELRPRVAVLDLKMPGMGGLDVVQAIMEKRLPVAVLILTMHNEEDIFNRAVSLGVKGYILKDSAVLEIVQGIQAVARGEYYFSPVLLRYVADAREASVAGDDGRRGIETLTPTERKVLHHIAENRVTQEIADVMFISPRTVEHHRANICRKLRLSGAYALVRFALQHKAHI